MTDDRDGSLAHTIVGRLLSASLDVEETPDVAAWWRAHRARMSADASPIENAIVGGFAADRIAFAFAGGYHAALCALLQPSSPPGCVAFCATEDGGAHPRAILTTLRDGVDGTLRLDGLKRFVTLATVAEELLVVARRGERPDGRPNLVVVRLPVARAGTVLEPLPHLPFASEIPHAAVRFEGVVVDETDVLPGDGYLRYLKPFRTIEDVYVYASLLGFVLRIARRDGWPREDIERALSLLVVAHTLATAPPSDAAVHLVLAGLVNAARAWIAETMPRWERAPAEERARFERDVRIVRVAEQARAARTAAAWRAFDVTDRGATR